MHPEDRAFLDLIFEGQDDADAASTILPFDRLKTSPYELRLGLSRRVLGIRVAFELPALVRARESLPRPEGNVGEGPVWLAS